MKYISIVVFGLLLAPVFAENPAKELTLTSRGASERGPKPMVAVWLEKEDGTFVQTLQRFGRRPKYFKALSEWYKLAKKESPQQLDAVTGATIKWRKTASITFPIKTEKYDLSEGNYVIRIESRAEKKKHHKDFKILAKDALKGGTFKHDGHVSQITVTIQ